MILPRTLSRALAVTHVTWLTGLRDRLYLSLLVAIAFAVAFALWFGALAYADPVKALLDAGQSAILAGGLVLVVFFVTSDLRREREGWLPVLLCECGRDEYILGKWLGYVALIAVFVGAGSGLLAGAAWLYGSGGPGLVQSAIGIAVELMLMAAAAILFSVLVPSTALAGLYTFAFYVAAHASADVARIGERVAEGSWQSVLSGVLRLILPDLGLLDHRLAAAHGLVAPALEFLGGLLYGGLWCGLVVWLACLAFRKIEI